MNIYYLCYGYPTANCELSSHTLLINTRWTNQWEETVGSNTVSPTKRDTQFAKKERRHKWLISEKVWLVTTRLLPYNHFQAFFLFSWTIAKA